jgi:hypothetical protein
MEPFLWQSCLVQKPKYYTTYHASSKIAQDFHNIHDLRAKETPGFSRGRMSILEKSAQYR